MANDIHQPFRHTLLKAVVNLVDKESMVARARKAHEVILSSSPVVPEHLEERWRIVREWNMSAADSASAERFAGATFDLFLLATGAHH